MNFLLEKGDKIGLVACSDGVREEDAIVVNGIITSLQEMGIV